MKKFIKKVALWTAFCLLITILFPYVVDPYNVFHVDNMKSNGVEPNKNYIKMTYLLEDDRGFDSYLFGSSRVAALHTEKIEDVNCYNMTYSAGNVDEHLANIRTLIDEGRDIKRVYVGVDSLSYTDNVRTHDGDPMRMSYEYIKDNREIFYKTYFDPLMTLRSLKVILSNSDVVDYTSLYERGWGFDYGHEGGGSWTEDMEAYIGSADNYAEYIDDVVASVEAIKELCAANGIELIVFTNPMQYVTYEASLERDYYVFLKKLSGVTDFYNFSGINDVTSNNNNYYDTSHYSAEIGDIMLDVMMGKSIDDSLTGQGFGQVYTSENVDELLAKQKEIDSAFYESIGE